MVVASLPRPFCRSSIKGFEAEATVVALAQSSYRGFLPVCELLFIVRTNWSERTGATSKRARKLAPGELSELRVDVRIGRSFALSCGSPQRDP